MNAIELLETQRHDIDELFARLERHPRERRHTFDELADAIAIHSTLEERHFYPAVQHAAQAPDIDELIERSLAEHRGIRRKLALAMITTVKAPSFPSRLAALLLAWQEHLAVERAELLPVAERVLDRAHLAALGQGMAKAAIELGRKHPRRTVPLQSSDSPLAQSFVARLLTWPLELADGMRLALSVGVSFVRGVQRGLRGERPI